MNKLLKLSETHYIIVDNSEKGKEGYNYNFALGKIEKLSRNYEAHSSEWNHCKKITHSTQPLEKVNLDVQMVTSFNEFEFINIKPISLSEVEELIYGYSVEKMAENYARKQCEDLYDKESISGASWGWETSLDYIKGFKAHQELVKDKLFTVDEVSKIFTVGVQLGINQELFTQQGKPLQDEEKVFQRTIQSLLPPTEWGVEFVDGKLKLI